MLRSRIILACAFCALTTGQAEPVTRVAEVGSPPARMPALSPIHAPMLTNLVLMPGDETLDEPEGDAEDEENPPAALQPAISRPIYDRGIQPPRSGAVLAEPFSALLGVGLVYDRFDSSTPQANQLAEGYSANMRIAARSEVLGGAYLQSEFRLFNNSETERSDSLQLSSSESGIERGPTRVTWDFPRDALRLEIGDIGVRTTNFQNSSRLLGLNLGRAYSELQPFRVVRPTGRRAITLDRRARVEVYVNGQLVDELRLDPGTYEVNEFTTEFGSRRVELIIRDDTGRVERVDFAAITSFQSLEPGIFDFNAAIGFNTRSAFSGLDYDYGDVRASAYARYGLSQRTTLGADFQIDQTIAMLGATAVHARSTGAVALGLGLSHDASGNTGLAARLAGETAFSERWPTLSAELSYFSADFDALGGSGRFARTNYSLNVQASQYINERASVIAGFEVERVRPGLSFFPGDSRYPWTAFIEPTVRVWRQINLSLALTAERFDSQEGTQYSALLTIRQAFRGGQVLAQHESRSQRSTVTASYFPPGAINRPGGRVTAQHFGETDRSSLTTDIGLSNPRFDASVFHNRVINPGRGSNARQSNTTLLFDTALGYAGGEWALGRASGASSGFGIVTPFEDDPSDPAFVDFGSMRDYRARTGLFGNALVTDIRPFINETLEISTLDAPREVRDPRECDPYVEYCEDPSLVIHPPPDFTRETQIDLYLPPFGGAVIRPRNEQIAVPAD